MRFPVAVVSVVLALGSIAKADSQIVCGSGPTLKAAAIAIDRQLPKVHSSCGYVCSVTDVKLSQPVVAPKRAANSNSDVEMCVVAEISKIVG